MDPIVVVATGLASLLGLFGLMMGFVKHFTDPISTKLDAIAKSGQVTAKEMVKMNEQLKGVHEKIDTHSTEISSLNGRVQRNREDIIILKEKVFVKDRT